MKIDAKKLVKAAAQAREGWVKSGPTREQVVGALVFLTIQRDLRAQAVGLVVVRRQSDKRAFG